MNYYLGVDGGGTKTKFIICDAFGRVQAQSMGGKAQKKPRHFWRGKGKELISYLMRDVR